MEELEIGLRERLLKEECLGFWLEGVDAGGVGGELEGTFVLAGFEKNKEFQVDWIPAQKEKKTKTTRLKWKKDWSVT